MPSRYLLDNLYAAQYITKNAFYKRLAMRDFIKVMKALSDPNRVKILKMLQHKSMCVCEMRAALGVAQPTVSKHLKILEDAGLVDFTKDGLWVNYHLAEGDGSPYAAALLGNLRHWLEEDPHVASLIEKLPSIRREEICCR